LHPILLRIPLPGGGHFEIASYGAMLALGTIFGAFVATILARRDGISRDTVIDITFWGVICGIIGAKLWFVAQSWDDYQDKWDLLRTFRGGVVYYGGLLGGTIGVVGYARWKRLPLLKTLDISAPAGALGLVFGRLGCFLNGCCYGRLTDSPLGIRFPAPSIPFVEQLDKGLVTEADRFSLPVLPYQLISAAAALALFALLLALRRTRRFYGEQFALFFIIYAVVRFSEEFLRGDNPPVLIGMSIPQAFSILMFIAGAAVFLYVRVRRPEGLVVRPPAGK